MSWPKILVAGRSGQVAQALAHVSRRRGHNLVCTGRPEFDLTQPESIALALERHAPDVVINTSAFTDVDAAESQSTSAYALNQEGVRALWAKCQSIDAGLIHLSTDCVFDGRLGRPYKPGDSTGPLSIYGASKLAGERVLAGQNALVIRVSWIFSRFGSNFLTTMLALAQSRNTITVVEDQFGCPTHAEDLAVGLIMIAEAAAQKDFHRWGLYHLAGWGETERANQARFIFSASQAIGGPTADVEAIATADYPSPARRPLNARLNCDLTEDVFGVRLPRWENRLKDAVVEYLHRGSPP